MPCRIPSVSPQAGAPTGRGGVALGAVAACFDLAMICDIPLRTCARCTPRGRASSARVSPAMLRDLAQRRIAIDERRVSIERTEAARLAQRCARQSLRVPHTVRGAAWRRDAVNPAAPACPGFDRRAGSAVRRAHRGAAGRARRAPSPVLVPTFVARIVNAPVVLSVVPITSSPGALVDRQRLAGHVDSSSADSPSTTSPSTGIFSPGRAASRSPKSSAGTAAETAGAAVILGADVARQALRRRDAHELVTSRGRGGCAPSPCLRGKNRGVRDA